MYDNAGENRDNVSIGDNFYGLNQLKNHFQKKVEKIFFGYRVIMIIKTVENVA